MRVAIIGSGLGGAVLADLLAGHHHVTLFERGAERPEIPPAALTTGQAFGLHPSFAYGLGGTTNFWHGGMIEMLADEMADAWPASIVNELKPYYSQVVRHLYGDRMRRAYEALPEHSTVRGVHPGYLFYPRAAFRAANSGFLTMAELRIGHRVERFEERDGGVVVVSSAGGELVRSEIFDRLVLAAGGLNSPLIIRASGMGGSVVGKHLTDHPMGFVAKLRTDQPSAEFQRLRVHDERYPYAAGMVRIRDEETGLWSAFYLRAAGNGGFRSDPYHRSFGFLAATGRIQKHLAALPHLRDPDFLWQAMESQLGVTLPSKHAYVMVVNEQEATGQGSVTADVEGRVIVTWEISDRVTGAIRRNLGRLADYVGAELILPEGDIRSRLWTAAHHSGTCRISNNPEDGVVSEELRVHGTDNVFVCDGSVLPSTGSCNTGLTIASLAHRLANSLLHENHIVPSSVRKRLVISGTNGAVGRMLRARLADNEFDWHAVDLRAVKPDIAPMRGAVFLHLANDSRSVDDNLVVQESAARIAEEAKIDRVIVPMSFSTLDEIGPEPIGPDLFNFGFIYSGSDPYAQGKLAAERFWLEWQAAKPGRRLTLLYVPTILGRRSAWTRDIASYAPDKTLLVPKIDRFSTTTETEFIDCLFDLSRDGLANGVNRRVVMSASRSLRDTIFLERGDRLRELALPRIAWSAIGRAYHGGIWFKALSAVRVLGNVLLRATSGTAIVPISVKYLHLFRQQSDLADRIESLKIQEERTVTLTKAAPQFAEID